MSAVEFDHERIGIVWLAHDRVADSTYVYDAVVCPRVDLAVLAAIFRDKGSWIPVLYDHLRIDEQDGIATAQRLADMGVEIFTASVTREAAKSEMDIRMSTRRLRVFDHLEDWFREYRRYRRDEKGEIPEDDTRLIGATGLAVTHLSIAISEAVATSNAQGFDATGYEREQSKNSTGY